MKDRERACIYYACEGECMKGHAGTFRDACQTCKDYKAKKGGRSKRKDLRREKTIKWEKDLRNYM